jgi:5-methyltetrahydropteroyltriglutamate--homocysteine methyltransferase
VIKSANLGYPRMGEKRELKFALEKYWKGEITAQDLENVAKEIRLHNWKVQSNLEYIPSNDFSFYDHILGFTYYMNLIPSRYKELNLSNLDEYFAMARGYQKDGKDVFALEMTKYFDTNYHYIVPEFDENNFKPQFAGKESNIIKYFIEAKDAGFHTRPVIIGPVTYLFLAKVQNPNALIEKLANEYLSIFAELKKVGCTDVQIDEPLLVTDLSEEYTNAYKSAYKIIKNGDIKIHLTTYFEDISSNLELLDIFDVTSIHLDAVRGASNLEEIINKIPKNTAVSLGIVDGRNIWKNDVSHSIDLIKKVARNRSVIIAPSCSTAFSPVNLENEQKLDEEFLSWLAFAKQKVKEIEEITNAVNGKLNDEYISANKKAIESKASSKRIHNESVKQRVANIQDADYHRANVFAKRKEAQKYLNLPLFPITTIGSFPQTADVRRQRNLLKKREISQEQYDSFIAKETKKCVEWQDEIGIDMPVHGEFERNDMVEFFGEQLQGFAFTQNGWVQSYGSRCVKPPIIFGDVSRPTPMTVRWSKYAASLTKRPMKGMLTGPITMMKWAFPRNDESLEVVCKQIALALRDETQDLENAGIKAIQMDEPAIREAMPLKSSKAQEYLKWAVDVFKLSVAIASDKTQVHTHMCYSEFDDIMSEIARMDADVISIETSRSNMELLRAFEKFNYPNDIGPGVYDIHSPRVPNKAEMDSLLKKAIAVLPKEQIWVNPDCGLKTRGWEEVEKALINMVEVAKSLR